MKKDVSCRSSYFPYDEAPPLKVWIAVLIMISTLGGLSIAAFNCALSEEAALISYELGRIRAFAGRPAPDKKPKRVIALGTSLLACATYFDSDMDEFSRKSGGRRIDFLRITRGAMSFDQVTPLLDDILAARPDLLIIERDLIFYRFNHHLSEQAQLHANFVRTSLKKVFTLATAYRGTTHRDATRPLNFLDSDKELERIPFKQGPSALSEYAQLRKLFARPDQYVNRELAEAFLDRARRSGIQVMLLELPRPREADAFFPKSDIHLMDLYINKYRHLYRVLSLRFPRELTLGYFRDYAHLNFRGRELFSAWLLSEIRKIGVGEGI